MSDKPTGPSSDQLLPLPETPRPGETPAPWGRTRLVGQAVPRVDGVERVSGQAVFPADVSFPDLLHGAIKRCPYPHARIKRVDVAPALKLPGVRAVLSGSGPEAAQAWAWDWGRVKARLFETECRFEGEPVAAVAAETPYQAQDALRAMSVEYEVLPHLVDEGRALAADAPAVQPQGNRVGQPQVYSRGDVAQGLAEAEVVLERTYATACELHTPLEPHGCVAKWDGDSLTLWESTQGVYAIQAQAARLLGLPLAKVRVIGTYMGGGFGSKLQPGKYTLIAALLARQARRPVKVLLSREETMLVAGNRPASRMRLKAGVKRDGTLTALDFSAVGVSGAWPAGGGSLLDWLVKDLYLCPHVRAEVTDVHIHAGPARPFRAPGHPQGAWALEQMMDALAEAIGLDPVALRLKNLASFSQSRPGRPPYTTTGLKDCLEKGAEAFGWAQARSESAASRSAGRWRRGVGMAAGMWAAGGGAPPSTVILKLFADGSLNLNLGASDLGTGTRTVMALVVAEELGVRPEAIQIESADTGTTQYATPSGGSKTVPTEAPAVRAAAIEVKRQILLLAAEELKALPERLAFTGREVRVKDEPSRQIALVDLAGLKRQGVLVGVGLRGPNPQGKAVNPFVAQFCEAAVHELTGEVKILRFLAAQDSGRVMNRLTYDSQVLGGITMGLGLALTEARRLDLGRTGKLLTRTWQDYKIPTALDVPAEATSLPIELWDAEANTAGAKGLGEPVTIPAAAAVANAIYHATGVRLTESPGDPTQLCRLLAERRKGG